MIENVMNIASDIASKSPVGVQMTKRSIIYSRDHTVQEGLDHIVSKIFLRNRYNVLLKIHRKWF